MKLDVFRSWCSAQGIKSSLEVKESNAGYRYTVLNSAVKQAGQLNLLQVPLSSCLIADSSEQLADRLEFEKNLGSDSDFAPYIDLIPPLESFQKTLPRFWIPDRLAPMEAADGGALSRRLQADDPRVNSPLVDPWALACVDSRCNFLPDQRYSLTPVLDMINHRSSVATKLCVDATGEDGLDFLKLEIDADTLPRISKSWLERLVSQPSDEIFISYGDLTNLQTLMNYGFVDEENPHNTEELQIRMIRQPTLTATIKSDGSIDEDSLGKLRQSLANTVESDVLQSLPDEEKNPLLFVSPRNEEEVFALIVGELEIAKDKVMNGLDLVADDELLNCYLKGRLNVLQAATKKIKDKFPQLLL
ncbi:hypothetical protein FisN_13Hh213 [Fistulifera solaris]|uniref:SET domain-containing protein n=1 Tax=Fistulifera solaris TaxID=1519565 RepID=A0A1Z5KNV2_FISSO|nr:hypothetical protein FisN_13Hh213 [Fistulifera solaris]|eukprot:GAX27691.1 hypothetical protein FisN_13Hh213 [Fistulifera solaris]